MLCALDHQLEGGDTRAVGPMIKLVAALDRYHGLDSYYRRLAPSMIDGPTAAAIEAKPALALTHAAAIETGSAELANVAEFGA
jgi:hypothetical protein